MASKRTYISNRNIRITPRTLGTWRAELLIEIHERPNPEFDVLFGEPLVGGVKVGSGQREAHQEYRRIEDPLELADDRDVATLAR